MNRRNTIQVSEASALRYIPKSSLEPFGYTGIPSLGTSPDAVNDMLEEMFTVVMDYTVGKSVGEVSVDNLAATFARRVLTRKLGTKTKQLWTTERICNKDGELLAISLLIDYTVPNDPQSYTSRFFMNPHCIVF